jgi:hypothetical protein
MQSALALQPENTTKTEALRQKILAETPRWYSPYVHVTIPSITGIAAIALALAQISGLTALQLLAMPITYVICNGIEWFAHKYLLHHRNPLAPVLYDQHTPMHHMVYTHEDMAIRDIREFKMVLIPAYGVFLIALHATPIWWALAHYGHANVGALWFVTAVGYAVGYEWLHLSYHLSPESTIGRLPIVQWLRKHHTIHHDPRLMQTTNFNVTVPLWDWLLGTCNRRG